MTKRLFLLALFSVVLTACSGLKYGVKPNDAVQSNESFRLPEDAVPIRYDLTLWADPAKDHFNGQVIIDLDLKNDLKQILIHGQHLEILSSLIKGSHGEHTVKFSELDKDGLLLGQFGSQLPKGSYQLTINYRAKYQEDLSGLYRVKEGEDFYLYTQFEPVDARKMLPCFDEPRFKTPFSFKVIAPKGQTVIANGALNSKFDQGNDEVHIFNTTKPIPTYLLALAVGPFDVVTGPIIKANEYRENDFAFRGIAVKGKGEKLAFALKETPQIIKRLESYFGVGYPYEKLDIIAVPDFGAGAMENVGAITFREWYLLLDEKTASVDQRRGFYLIMAHELAHQWFGNLVTMPWWDDLWLNEAFATWLSYKVVDTIKPEFKAAEQLLKRSHSAMAQDTLLAVRKIREPIVSKHDIHSAFDSITYEKGGALLNMLENYLGPSTFRTAVSAHIKRFEFGLATSKDFLESLAKFSQRSLVDSAETFLNQNGLPLLSFSYEYKKDGTHVTVEQRRYVPIGSKALSTTQWKIPVCFGYEANGKISKQCFMLDQPKATITLAGARPAFVMPNYQGQGYYRYSLSVDAWNALLKKIELLSERDRISIAESLIGELYAGTLDFAFVAEHLRALVTKESSLVTNYFVKLIDEANDYWISDENRDHVLRYVNDLRRLYKELSAMDLSEDQRVLRRDIAGFLAKVTKDQDVRNELSILGTSYLNEVHGKVAHADSTKRDENLIDHALAVVMQEKDDEGLINLQRSLHHLSDTVIRNHLLYGFALSREGEAANTIRNMVFDNLRRNEKLSLLYRHLDNPKNQPATWKFVQENFDKMKKTLSNSQMANLPYLAEGLCTVESSAEVNEFFAPTIHEYRGGPRTLAEVVEQIEICAARKSHTAPLVNAFFDESATKAASIQK